MRQFNNRQFIINALIAAPIIFVLVIIDLFYKKLFFDNPGFFDRPGPVQHDFVLFGIRSLAHSNSTFFSTLNLSVPDSIHNLFGYLIAIFLSIWLLFSKNKFRVIAIAITIGGVLGNTIDRTTYGFVRDIIFTPWFDKGTFNLSDLIIMTGVGLVVLSLLIDIFTSRS
ncbi:MAG: signal peptidase II [Mycoplasmatales bacterium]|nr:signal peptidase II [Mycoplasmatales bacterium]